MKPHCKSNCHHFPVAVRGIMKDFCTPQNDKKPHLTSAQWILWVSLLAQRKNRLTDKRTNGKKFSFLFFFLGKISENGCDLSMERYYDSSFFIPFRLDGQLGNYSADVQNRLQQRATVPHSRIRLFLEFKKETSYVIRVSVLYKQMRILAISSDKKAYRNCDIDQ